MELAIIKSLSILSAVIYGIQIFRYSKKIVTLKANVYLSTSCVIAVSIFFGWLSFQNILYCFIYILMYAAFVSMYLICFKGNLIVFLFASGNFIFHLLCVKGILITMMAFCMNVSMHDVISHPMLRSLTTIILFVSVSVFLVFFRMVYSEEKINRLIEEISQVKLITAIQAVLNTTLVGITLVYSYDVNVQWLSFYHFLLSFMMVLGFYVIFKYCVGVCLQKDYQEKEEILKFQIESQLQQYQNQSRYIKDLRRIKHDYNNQMAGLGYIAETGDYEKIREYLRDLSNEVNMSKVSYVQFSNHYLIDAILQDVYIKVRELKIKFEALVSVSILPLSDFEICTVLSNLMNNAIEACQQVEENQRFINVKSDMVGNYWIIKIANSFDGIYEKVNGKLITRKKDKNQHGLGVETVEKVVMEHEGEVQIRPNLKDRIFEVFVFLPITKE